MEPVTDTSTVRRQQRLTIDISVRVLTKHGVSTFGRAHDFSPRGMSFYAGVELAVGDKIQAEFQLPNSRLKLNISALVRNRNGFRYGIEFDDLTTTDSAEIARVFSILSLTQL